jgi:hypothetical protein
MAVLGGAMFLLIGALNEVLTWQMPLLLQGLIGAAAVTAAEFVAGLYLNLWLELNIWDYSNLPVQLWDRSVCPLGLLGSRCPSLPSCWTTGCVICSGRRSGRTTPFCFWEKSAGRTTKLSQRLGPAHLMLHGHKKIHQHMEDSDHFLLAHQQGAVDTSKARPCTISRVS